MIVKHTAKALVGILLVMGIGAGRYAQAHHSFAMFDRTRFLNVKGIVRRIEWANPHTYLYVESRAGDGGTALYTIECASPNILNRWGWKYNEVRAGDEISVGFYPLRNGERGGLLFSVTLANGMVLKGN